MIHEKTWRKVTCKIFRATLPNEITDSNETPVSTFDCWSNM